MGNSPETKSNPEVLKVQESKKNLDEINKKIEFHKTEAERLKQNPNYLNDKLLFAQIFEHEEAIKNLKEEQAKILAESKGYINSQKAEITPINDNQKDILREEIKKSSSTDEEKQKALQEIENAKTSADLNEINFWDGPMSLILKFFAFITWYTNEDFSKALHDESVEKYKLSWEYHMDFESLLNSKWWEWFKENQNYIIYYANKFWINPWTVLKLMIKEWSGWDVTKWPGWKNTATWFWQITDWTWNDICNRIAPKYLWQTIDKSKRFDAPTQILATCLYLDFCAKTRWVSHEEAMIYYHTWPWKITDETAKSYINNNPAIARVHWPWPVTAESYKDAAMRYYLN